MDVRAGRLAGDEIAEGVVWDLIRLQIFPQPFAFCAVGEERYVDTVAMIEAEGTVQGCLSLGTDWQGLLELLLISQHNVLEIFMRERAITVKTLHHGAANGGFGSLLGLDRLLFGTGLLGQFMDQLGSLHY